ncbi:hypothetical protein GCM10007939_22720 [Amylibacter marinus]|uniref:SMODS and SLOG-associating 2TM effector domain-containing protein n=1 Tax=Amylibacter marinus TaxID=1475483 RepID=A0ABQ5VXL1_9RHOB|nr:hypothetical protein [Amylibacter marinus]GLQ35988.1 hypothetical protein GCM10007939_22720 [Amylibacter marinus]
MNLLFKRSQKAGRRITFNLWAKAELTDEEQNLIEKYKMHNAVLVEAIQPGLIRRSLIVSIFGFLGSAVVVAIVAGLGTAQTMTVSVILGLIIGYAYFHEKRETIYVSDLIHGRIFKCRSIIELARREAHLESITGYFRQVVESAKHWGGTQSKPIEPLPPEEAKRFILAGPML